MRLKPDVSVEADDPHTKALLGRLAEGVRSVAVHDPETGAAGVLVPVDRYVELVARALKQKNQWGGDTDGRIWPAGLAEADIEQVDSGATWIEVPGRQQT